MSAQSQPRKRARKQKPADKGVNGTMEIDGPSPQIDRADKAKAQPESVPLSKLAPPKNAYKEPANTAVRSGIAAQESTTSDKPDQIDDIAAEPSIGDQLKSLRLKTDDADNKTLSLAPATSLTQTLVQALHSADTKLLESCLAHQNQKLIRATLERLPLSLVVPLVDAIVARLGRTKRGYGQGIGGASAPRARGLVEWLRGVLVVHVSYLVTIPTLIQKLSTLHATLEQRVSLHQRLLALNGRLELVTSQIDHKLASQQSKAASRDAIKVATSNYVEGESTSEESSSEDEDSDDDGEIQDINVEATEMTDGETSEDEEEDDLAEGFANGLDGLLDLEAEEDSDEEREYHTDSGSSSGGSDDLGLSDEDGDSEEEEV